ncbi:MAG: protein kinase [Pirellulaceae bacterium]
MGRFQILKRIGSGKYGCVYLAYDIRLTRQVAVKVSHLGQYNSGELRGQFIRERHAARGWPTKTVCLHEYGEEHGVLFLVYEMCEGPTLADWIPEQRSYSAQRVCRHIVRDIANGLAHAHSRG